jgi:hypothetical protein
MVDVVDAGLSVVEPGVPEPAFEATFVAPVAFAIDQEPMRSRKLEFRKPAGSSRFSSSLRAMP